jgi:sec-independent protein translocase protein TatC
MGLEPDVRFTEWLSFAILMPLVFGISFQLPLVMVFLERIGVFSREDYVKKWRMACFLIHVFAMVMVPSADMFSMEGLAIPMFGLYLLGIFLCRLNPSSTPDSGVPDPEEMVGV